MTFLHREFEDANEALADQRQTTVAAAPSARRARTIRNFCEERADTIPCFGAPPVETEPAHVRLAPYMCLGMLIGVGCAEAWWIASRVVQYLAS